MAEAGSGDPPEKCRHDRYLYCDECRTDSWMLGCLIGRQEGLNTAALTLKGEVGRLFAEGKDSDATMLRSHMRKIEDLAKEAGDHADEIRQQQGILKRGPLAPWLHAEPKDASNRTDPVEPCRDGVPAVTDSVNPQPNDRDLILEVIHGLDRRVLQAKADGCPQWRDIEREQSAALRRLLERADDYLGWHPRDARAGRPG